MAGERELKEFLSHPDKYVPPIAPNKLPPSDLRPQRLTSTQAQEYMPRQIELKGFCPVTFLDNKCRCVTEVEVWVRDGCRAASVARGGGGGETEGRVQSEKCSTG